MDKAAPDPLLAIRGRIDAIDEAMHRLLVERSGVIAELIRVKGTSKPGAAFRPDREADMMRRIAMRHSGGLPLATVEHIWREIITTFTAMQAPFGVIAGPSRDALAMRDSVRFYFGFAVGVTNAKTNEDAMSQVAASGRDVAVVATAGKGRWWRSLAGARAPKVFAKLPFIDLPERPADLPAYVVGPPLKQNSPPDVRVLSVTAAPHLKKAVSRFGGVIAARNDGECLVELPIATELAELAEAAKVRRADMRDLGGFFQPIRFLAERTP